MFDISIFVFAVKIPKHIEIKKAQKREIHFYTVDR